MEQRIIELEKKAAFQDHTIEELNDVIIAQEKRLNELEKQVKELKEHLSKINLMRNPKDEEPPPHY